MKNSSNHKTLPKSPTGVLYSINTLCLEIRSTAECSMPNFQYYKEGHNDSLVTWFIVFHWSGDLFLPPDDIHLSSFQLSLLLTMLPHQILEQGVCSGISVTVTRFLEIGIYTCSCSLTTCFVTIVWWVWRPGLRDYFVTACRPLRVRMHV